MRSHASSLLYANANNPEPSGGATAVESSHPGVSNSVVSRYSRQIEERKRHKERELWLLFKRVCKESSRIAFLRKVFQESLWVVFLQNVLKEGSQTEMVTRVRVLTRVLEESS